MISYCIIKIDFIRSEERIVNELFQLYGIFLNRAYYADSQSQFLHKDLYRAIVVYAVRLHRTKWLRGFIDKYSQFLHPNDENNMKNLAYAYYYYATHAYEMALEFLNKLHADQLSHKFDIHNLRLKIFYDRGDYLHLPECIHTYIENLRANKLISPVKRRNYAGFIKYFGKLVLYKLQERKIDLGYYLYGLEKQPNLAFRDWLKERYQKELGIYTKTG